MLCFVGIQTKMTNLLIFLLFLNFVQDVIYALS